MADTKISALPAVAAALLAQEYPVNDVGVSKKQTVAQLLALVAGSLPLSPIGTSASLTNDCICLEATSATIVTIFYKSGGTLRALELGPFG